MSARTVRSAARAAAEAVRSGLQRRVAMLRARTADDAGMTTAEYAVGTIAACAFAGVLWAVVRSGTVHDLVQSMIERAFAVVG